MGRLDQQKKVTVKYWKGRKKGRSSNCIYLNIRKRKQHVNTSGKGGGGNDEGGLNGETLYNLSERGEEILLWGGGGVGRLKSEDGPRDSAKSARLEAASTKTAPLPFQHSKV
jgi:hypothetical protein